MSGKYGHFRRKLLTRRDELQVRLDSIKKDVSKKANADWSEQAQERENDEVLDALGNEAVHELRLIQKALERIEEDEYTECSGCGNDIPVERLEIMPYTDVCVKCAERQDG